MIALSIVLACTGSDPELAAQKRAISHWEVGQAALQAGDAAAGRSAMDKALAQRPEDRLLMAWQASAAAAAGDLEGAVGILDSVLKTHPGFAEARYNRAAYLARLGKLDQAGRDLQQAVDDGARRSREAVQDADFQPHLEHPAFAFLPKDVLLVALDAPSETAFWGSEVSVRLRVVGAEGVAATVEADTLSGPLRVVGALEDVVESTEGLVRDLTWTFRVEGPGEAVLGPFEVRAGPFRKTVRAVEFPTAAPPGKSATDLPPLALRVPTALAGDHTPPDAWLADGVFHVLAGVTDRVVLTPTPEVEAGRFELRDRSQPVWVLYRYLGVKTAPKVKITRLGQVILDE